MTIIIDGTVGANKAVVLDANSKLPAIDGSQVTALNASEVTTGSIATARIDTGTTTGKVLVLDGSGNMPAIAGGAMTGVSSATKSASDPAIDTNPATGLGTKWINTTSGDIYVCTDATTDENVWTNVGARAGNILSTPTQGTQFGFFSGGANNSTGLPIHKFSFTSDGNATDHGDLTQARNATTGVSSFSHGYTCGGYIVGPPVPASNVIDKFAFGSSGNATNVGDLVHVGFNKGGHQSTTYGFVSGGYAGGPNVDMIQRFSFASDGNATDWADLNSIFIEFGGNSSMTHGYQLGGGNSAANPLNNISKFPFASQTNGTDVGDLTLARRQVAASSSNTYAYASGGCAVPTSTRYDRIDKCPFASDANATSVGNLTSARVSGSGSSSTAYGYHAAGNTGSATNEIQKYSHTTDGNATDVGDLLTVLGHVPAGTQY